ncbi:MAG: hypothetical protein JOZ72_12165 [Alphaproteobacteria bacterium]|nr:hypothetical protein [Alphaproteobacteria bacterium]
MLKHSVVLAVAVVASTPAFADLSSCYEPIAPVAVDGSTATEDQMKHALKDVKDFIASSDDYQLCLNSQLIQMKKDADKSKDKQPLDPSVQANVQSKIDANQKLKEKVGNEYNAAAVAYNAKHPKTP